VPLFVKFFGAHGTLLATQPNTPKQAFRVTPLLGSTRWSMTRCTNSWAMTPGTSLEKSLALIGARRGGKSTALRVMTWLCGASHVISRTLNDLGGEFGLEGALD
jgi:hypothetical protein